MGIADYSRATVMIATQHQAVFDAALALPETERMLLVERLLDSLPADVDDLNDEELLAELDRRRAEIQRDPSIGILWTEVLKPE